MSTRATSAQPSASPRTPTVVVPPNSDTVDPLSALRPASVARRFFRAARSLRRVRVAEELDDESLLACPEARLD
jgi:hypothetical protein